MRELDAAARDRIAAGEVVTRPDRVVGELVDNALDAGAGRIEVDVEGDGTDLLRVTDDGAGMRAEAAELAVRRHTTTKIDCAADLETVGTLGFRGEALASVAAVSRLDLVTNDGGAQGVRVTVEDGQPETEPAGRGVGTTVTVRDLFYNRPPRRASLAAAGTEFARIADLVGRYALVYPGVAFRLTHDGSETFSTPGSGDPTDAALGVYDRAVAGRSTTLDAEATVEIDGRPREIGVTGLLCHPSVTRAAGEHVTAAVNGRPVTGGPVREGVLAGYRPLIAGDRYPVAAVDASLAPALVDPNVHPAKERVAISGADAVAGAVEGAVDDALSTADRRRAAGATLDLDGSLAPVDGDSALADATVIGRYRGLYVLCEADGELLVVDQHAAHERVNYERLRAVLGDAAESVPVDPPATVSLSAAGVRTVEANRETLSGLGFEVEPFGGTAVRVRAVPAPRGRPADPEALRDVVDALRAGDDPTVRETALADLACHPSLRAGDDLSTAEATALLDHLGACDNPYACPHGRPTVLAIEEETLVRGFDRERTRLG